MKVLVVCFLISSFIIDKSQSSVPFFIANWSKIKTAYKNYTTNLMDSSANVCENFYKYSCGKAGEFFKLKDNQYIIDHLLLQISLSLKETYESDTEFFVNYTNNDIITQSKFYYESCMDIKTIKSKGVKPLLDVINSLGGLPALNPEWNESEANWSKLLGELRLIGESYIIDSKIASNINEPTKFILTIEKPSFHFDNINDYMSENKLNEYKNELKTIFSLLGDNKNFIEALSNEIINFEMKLVNISNSVKNTINPDEITIEKLIENYSGINWKSYLTQILEKEVNDDDKIIVDSNYLKLLMSVLKETAPVTIYNYALGKFALSQKHLILTEETKDENNKNRWEFCIEEVKNRIDIAVGVIFTRKYTKGKKRTEAKLIAENIQNKYKEVIKSLSWLNSMQIEKAINQIDSINFKIGLSEFVRIRSGRKKLYKDFQINKENFFNDSIELIKLKNKINFNHFSKVEDALQLYEPNIWYDALRNSIKINSALIQLPMFHPVFPFYRNYGVLGTMIGNSLSHVFNDIWSSTEEVTKYRNCFKELFNGYGVNENYNIEEDLADNIGIKVAYLAYKDWLKENANDKKKIKKETINGLNLTSEQLFFISFTQSRCGKDTEPVEKLNDSNLLMLPQKVRVLGVLSNSIDFSENFKCDENSKWNRKEKCTLF